MKNTITIITIILLNAFQQAYAENNYLPDSIIKEMLVGKWTASPKDELYGTAGGLVQYNADGTLLYTKYKTAECKVITYTVNATWGVRAKKLIVRVSNTDNSHPIKDGTIVTDRIVHIDKKNAILKNIDGIIQYRMKVNSCGKT